VTQAVSTPPGWLTVTPDTGHAPLTLTITVNPTGLTRAAIRGPLLSIRPQVQRSPLSYRSAC
jgi:hypothetical protein